MTINEIVNFLKDEGYTHLVWENTVHGVDITFFIDNDPFPWSAFKTGSRTQEFLLTLMDFFAELPTFTLILGDVT